MRIKLEKHPSNLGRCWGGVEIKGQQELFLSKEIKDLFVSLSFKLGCISQL